MENSFKPPKRRTDWAQILILSGVGISLLLTIIGWKNVEKPVDLAVTVAGTLVAAWAGGWAAFSAERKTRDDAELDEHISAANKALFIVATMFNVFDNLSRFFIAPGGQQFDSSQNAITIDSPLPGMMRELHFDFDSLNYFLDPDGDVCSMALMELQLLDWHYHIVVNTVELRAQAMENLHLAARANPVANMTPDAIRIVYRADYQRLERTTVQLVEQVNAGIELTKAMYEKLKIALELQFPGQTFLQINFAERPTVTSAQVNAAA